MSQRLSLHSAPPPSTRRQQVSHLTPSVSSSFSASTLITRFKIFQLLLICGESDVTCLFHFVSSFREFFEVLKLCSSSVTVVQAREASIQVTTERKARRPEFHGIRRHVASLVGSMLRHKLCQCALLLAPVEKMSPCGTHALHGRKTTRVLAPVVGQKFDAVIHGSSNQKTMNSGGDAAPKAPQNEASLDLGHTAQQLGVHTKIALERTSAQNAR